MVTEIPDNVMAAIKAVVEWYRGCDGPDGIIEHDLPVIDAWLAGLGVKLTPYWAPADDTEAP
jgi:hypothetical protein